MGSARMRTDAVELSYMGPKTMIKLSVDTSNPTICPDITGLLSRAELQETTQLQEIGNKSSWINIIPPNKGNSFHCIYINL